MSLSGAPPGGNGAPRLTDAPGATREGDTAAVGKARGTGTIGITGTTGTATGITAGQGPGVAPPPGTPLSKVTTHLAQLTTRLQFRRASDTRGLAAWHSGLAHVLQAHWPQLATRLLQELRGHGNDQLTGKSDIEPVEALRPGVASLVLGTQFDAALRSTRLTEERLVRLIEGPDAYAFRRLSPDAQDLRLPDLLRSVMATRGGNDRANLALITRARAALCPSPVDHRQFLLGAMAFASNEAQMSLLIGEERQHLMALSPVDQQRVLEGMSGRLKLMRLVNASPTRFHPDQGTAATRHHFGQWLECLGHPPLEMVMNEPSQVRWSWLENFAGDPLMQPDVAAHNAWSGLEVEQRLLGLDDLSAEEPAAPRA